ncbi:hypothetical protein FA95DRAFT_1514832 [Auriscalpium vulgare]|uniref:Uncharacterized protein n=1 Tax=Auriscalpium vulgare TaxID=40419 RepID=A0ACB8S0Q5_9AGAM|nr:hypothetical protein FA95DRAFT_1514832 [Auriscalpium vulgare]
MLVRGPSPAREDSPASTAIPLTAAPVHHAHNNKKRKHNALASHTATASPAPSEPGSSSLNPAENVVLPSYHDLATRPRLTISRHPVFVPLDERSPYNSTEQLAFNRIGFRYMPAGLAPPGTTLPFRTIESAPAASRVSWEDRSPFVKVTQDGLGLLGEKGFRSARCNAPVREGKWYMEVAIECGGGERQADAPPNKEGAHVRLGWGRREAPLNGPCGLDGYSYGVRDKTGEKVTLSRPRPYGRAFHSGDVVGMYISLPPLRQPNKNDQHDPAHVHRERIAIEFKGQEYFESLEYPQSKEMIALMDFSRKPADSAPVPPSTKKSATVKNVPERGRGGPAKPEPPPSRALPTLPDSNIAFFVNGESQGVAFRDLYDFLPLRAAANARKVAREKSRAREGTRQHKENPFDDGCIGYFPFISLFNGARVRLNPGPDFAFPPPPDVDALLSGRAKNEDDTRTWRPLSERYTEFMEEQWALDATEEVDARVEAAQRDELQRAEDAKKEKRERKRTQADSRKRAKREAELAAAAAAAPAPLPEPSASASYYVPKPEPEGEPKPDIGFTEPPAALPMEEDMRFGPDAPLPAFVLSGFAGDEGSPVPTGASTPGVQSGYGSELGDAEIDAEGDAEEVDVEPEEEEEEEDPYDPYRASNYRSAMRMEMEEDE